MIERPDLSEVPTPDLVEMMVACAMSGEPSDKEFAKFCREEIKKRKAPSSDINGLSDK